MTSATFSDWSPPSIFGRSTELEPSPRGWSVHLPADSSQWKLVSALTQLDAIGALSDDWDGYGGAAIDAAAIDAGKVFLVQLIALPQSLLPNSNGTLSFEWESPYGRAHLEIGAEAFSFYAAPRFGQPTFLSGDLRVGDAEDINSALATVTQTRTPGAVTPTDWAGGVARLHENN